MTFEPGIYFGLDEERYHADEAFSGSGANDMLISTLTYWANTPMNPAYEPKETEARDVGKGFHKRIIEGPDAFYSTFAPEADKSDFVGIIVTAADMKDELRRRDLPVCGKVADLCERLREADPSLKLWPKIAQEYGERHAGKTFLRPSAFKEIDRAAGIIDRQVGKAFTGGMPEVSLFWIDEETGIRMKGRLDYLKVQAIVELKTFSNPLSRSTDRAIAAAMANYRYHVKAVIYLHGLQQLKEKLAKGQVMVQGDHDPKWLDVVIRHPNHTFVFVFVEKGPAPNVRVREFRRQLGQGEPNLYFTSAWLQYRWAVDTYVRCKKQFGEDPWIEGSDLRAFDDTDFPLWMFD